MGVFSKIDPKSNSAMFFVIEANALCVVVARPNFEFDFCILSAQGNTIYACPVTENFYVYIDELGQRLTWIDQRENRLESLDFRVYAGDVRQFQQTVSACVVQNKKKMSVEQYSQKEKNDWDKYYMHVEDAEEVTHAENDYKCFLGDASRVWSSKGQRSFKSKAGVDKSNYTSLFQAKKLNLCVAGKDNQLDIFEFQNDGSEHNLKQLDSLPGIRDKKGNLLELKKLQF